MSEEKCKRPEWHDGECGPVQPGDYLDAVQSKEGEHINTTPDTPQAWPQIETKEQGNG